MAITKNQTAEAPAPIAKKGANSKPATATDDAASANSKPATATKKNVAAAKAVPVDTDPVTVTTTDEAPSTEPAAGEVEVPLADKIVALIESVGANVASVEALLKSIKADSKLLQRDFVKFQKAAASVKRSKKEKKAPGGEGAETQRRNSGFQKPTGISDQLADFLQVPHGSQLPRMEVTRRINEYIRANNLQDPTDRRKIIPNDQLHALLGTTADTAVSYFNYQGFLKGHFIAAPATPAAPAPAAPADADAVQA